MARKQRKQRLSTYEGFVKGIKDFEKSDRDHDAYLAMIIATSRAFRGGIGLGGAQISEAIDEALKGEEEE